MNELTLKLKDTTPKLEYSQGMLFHSKSTGTVYMLRKYGSPTTWVACVLGGAGTWRGAASTPEEATEGLIYLGKCRITVEQL